MAFDFEVTERMATEARNEGMTLSGKLELLDPAGKYPLHEQGMDAFERQLARYDVATASDPKRGLMSDKWERWHEINPDGNAQASPLALEWVRRQYARMTQVQPRNGMMSGNWNDRKATFDDQAARFPVDNPISYSLYPPAVYDQLRFQMLQPSLLNVLVARTRSVSSEAFVAMYLTDSTATTAARLSRVDEYGEIPRQRFQQGEQTIRVHKYGGGLDISYEALRRMQLDLVSWWIMYVAAKSERDKEDSAVNVLINGDGNSGSAATVINGSTLDAAAGGALTLIMWLMFRLQFVRPYRVNVVVGANTPLVKLLTLNAGSANLGPQAVIGSTVPNAVNVTMARTTLDNVLAVDNTTAPANQLMCIDGNWALEMIQEAGSNIVETNVQKSNQFSSIFISETVGWAIAIKGQNKLLAYTA